MNLVNPYRFKSGGTVINTFISCGEGGNPITSASDLVALTSLGLGDISDFSVDSFGNVKCFINVDYTINSVAFENGNVLGIKSYIDLDGKVTSIGGSAFRNCSDLLEVAFFPNCININDGLTFATDGSGRFQQHLRLVNLKSCASLGLNTGDNSVFLNNKNNLKGYFNNTLSTANGGSPDGDIIGVKTIRYNTNSLMPDNVTSASLVSKGVDFIEVSWSAPSAANGVDSYMVFANDFYYGLTESTSLICYNLDASTTYEISIIAIDQQGNYGERVTALTTSTDATVSIPSGNIISYWNFNSNSNDQVGTNNGVATSISYVAGKVSNAADFNGSPSHVSISSSPDLSFHKKPFTLSFWINFDSLPSSPGGWIFNKRGASSNREYQVILNTSNQFSVQFFDDSNGVALTFSTNTFNPVGSWNNFIVTYNGSNGSYCAELYLNNIKNVGSRPLPGTFQNMQAGSNDLFIGRAAWSSSFYINAKKDETVLFNKVLSTAERAEVYNKGFNGNPII